MEVGKFKFSGSILKELSGKIPSVIIALNELIKNSYDAGANFIEIVIDSKLSNLVIKDDGEGIDREGINTLFHIGKSTKNYGSINKYKRYTQGSKGLGFLAVFKFGRQFVEWETKTKYEEGYSFSINFDDIVKSDNITDYEVLLRKSSQKEIGTKITIKLEKEALEYLKKYFMDKENLQKILYSFQDENFKIELKIDSESYSNLRKIDMKNIASEYQKLRITYDSEENNIIYTPLDNSFPNKEEFFSIEKYKYINKFSIKFDIFIYKFPQKGIKNKKIDNLFMEPKKDKLTPLVYINDNLFNNYTLFDPEINRGIKANVALPQMIGIIKIYSNDSLLDFNSDRTNLIENSFTEEIKEFLKNINKKIQSSGAKFLKEIENKSKNEEKNTVINSKENKKDKEIESNDISEKNKNPNSGTLFKVDITLEKDLYEIAIPSSQINLYNFIKSTQNSKGEKINYLDIKISSPAQHIEKGVLQSITSSQELKVFYEYSDPQTGLLKKAIILKFIKNTSSIKGNEKVGTLFEIPGKESYNVSYDITVVKLINQINKLDKNKYIEVIACSLRSIFEISVDCLRLSKKFENKIGWQGDLSNKVENIVIYLRDNQNIITEISNNTKISYNELKNILQPSFFKSYVELSNLGAHHSAKNLTTKEIEDIAKRASFFVVIVNELLENIKIL